MAKRRDINEYKIMLDKGLSMAEIAKRMGVTRQSVYDAKTKLRGHAHKEIVDEVKNHVKREIFSDPEFISATAEASKKHIEDILAISENNIEEDMDLAIKVQTVTNSLLMSRSGTSNDPEFIKAVSMFNKVFQDSIKTFAMIKIEQQKVDIEKQKLTLMSIGDSSYDYPENQDPPRD